MNNKTWYLYSILDTTNGHYYYGVRGTTDLENDKYMGSGSKLKEAIKEKGRDKFKKTIHIIEDDITKILELEALIVDEETLTDPLCYNIKLGGLGFPVLYGQDNPTFGKARPEEVKAKISETLKARQPEQNGMFGKNHTEETKTKLSKDKSIRLYMTPWGVFRSIGEIAKCPDIDVAAITVYARCMNPDKLVQQPNKTPKKYWNKTWRENGFWFEDKN